MKGEQILVHNLIMEISLELVTLRNILFDTQGENLDYIISQYIHGGAIASLDKNEELFHYEKETNKLWNIIWWKKSVEREKEFRAKESISTAKWKLQEEALRRFAKGLYNISGQDRETGLSIGRLLMRKKEWAKFEFISGLKMDEDKWKGLKE